MGFYIRKIEEQDFLPLISLFQEFARFEKTPEKMTNSPDRMRQEKSWIDGFVAISPEEILVGYVTCNIVYYTWTGKSMYMDDLYVQPSFRGKGIGSALINKVIGHARETNCYQLRWQVSTWNEPAIKFYKSLGAEVIASEQKCNLIL